VTDILNEPITIDEPNKNAVRISILLDESGSMLSVAKATIDALNKYVDEQKTSDNLVLVSLYTFNSTTGVKNRFRSVTANSAPRIFRNNDLFENPQLEEHLIYAPSGNTPLYDAIAEVISTESTGVPTLVVILSDGAENSSKEYTLEKVQALIKGQEAEKWSFVFLMAGLERSTATLYTSQIMGRDYSGSTMTYSKGAEQAAFTTLTNSTKIWGDINRSAVGVTLDADQLAKSFFANTDIKNT